MLRAAFKIASEAASRGDGLGRIFSEGIARVTGGRFSHVAAMYGGTLESALCWQSVEPDGTGFATLDLSDAKLWEVVEIDDDPSTAATDYAWMQGCSGQPYNFAGILSFATHDADLEFERFLKLIAHPLSPKFGKFCSQAIFRLLQDRRGKYPSFKYSELVAPSGCGKGDGRYGLYEILKGTQTLA